MSGFRQLEGRVRKDAKERRERIVTAAARVFARNGYAVALDAIAVEAGVGRATLYRNFADRCQLALAVLDRHIEDVAAAAHNMNDRPDAFLAMLRTMCEGRTDHGALAAAIAAQHGETGRHAIAILRAKMEGVCAVPVARAQRAGLLRPDFELSEIHRLTLMLAAGAAEWDRSDESREFDRALKILLEGIAPRLDSDKESDPINIPVDESQNKRSDVSTS